MPARAYLFLKGIGRGPLEEYLHSINAKREIAYIQATVDKLIQNEGNLPPPYAKKVRDKVWELRFPLGSPVFYFIDTGREIILLDGHTKKRNRIEPRALDCVWNMYQAYLATRRRKLY